MGTKLSLAPHLFLILFLSMCVTWESICVIRDCLKRGEGADHKTRKKSAPLCHKKEDLCKRFNLTQKMSFQSHILAKCTLQAQYLHSTFLYSLLLCHRFGFGLLEKAFPRPGHTWLSAYANRRNKKVHPIHPYKLMILQDPFLYLDIRNFRPRLQRWAVPNVVVVDHISPPNHQMKRPLFSVTRHVHDDVSPGEWATEYSPKQIDKYHIRLAGAEKHSSHLPGGKS